MSPLAFYNLLAAILIIAGTAGINFFLDLGPTTAGILISYLAAINVVVFGYYGHDKMAAQHRGRRVPEVVLHGLALLGGSVGAFAGMHIFRHKTLKGAFHVGFWILVALQVAAVATILILTSS
jgi:uncharacterized membrane protein YsdA (DUF1294 family)